METGNTKPVPMQVYPLDETWFEGVTPDAKKHLLSSLASLAKGRAPCPSFKLYGRTDVGLIDDFLARVKKAGIQVPEWQFSYELSRKAKFGPQGGYAPWSELKEDFELYFSRPTCDVKYQVHPDVLKKYESLHCTLPSLPETMRLLIKDEKIQERAAGWRNFDLKKTDPIAQAVALADATNGNWRKAWAYTFSRYNKLKRRIFMPGPFSVMLLEAQWYYPFLKAIQASLTLEHEHSPFTFWADKIGFDPMFEEIVTPLARKYDPTHFVYVQRDFEKMDTTQGYAQTQRSMLPRLAKAFHTPLKSAPGQRMEELFKWGGNIPIATPDGMYCGYHGKASGANTTNGDETCGNEDFDRTLTDFVLEECGRNGIVVELVYTAGNGDDGFSLWWLKDLGKYDAFCQILRNCAEKAAQLHGYRLQAQKWFISTAYGLYCQRMVTWKDDHVWNAYPAALILNSIINPEHQYAKSVWDKDYRDLDIIEKLDNGANLQYFELLVDFVDNGMKYRLLGRSEKETYRILSKWERYRALRYDRFNYRDPRAREISHSPTIRYLLSKRNIAMP